MIGGKVYSIDRWPIGSVDVIVQGTGCENGDFAEVKLARTGEALTIKIGDQLWWQGRNAYWTTTDGSIVDVPIPRLGYSTAVPTERQ